MNNDQFWDVVIAELKKSAAECRKGNALQASIGINSMICAIQTGRIRQQEAEVGALKQRLDSLLPKVQP
jgi:hypothetical protein